MKEKIISSCSHAFTRAADRIIPRRHELFRYPARRISDVAIREMFFGSDYHLANSTQVHVYRDTVSGGLLYDGRPPSLLNHGVPNRDTLPYYSTLEIKYATAENSQEIPDNTNLPPLADSSARTRRVRIDDYAQTRLQQAGQRAPHLFQKAALRAGQVLTDIAYIPQTVFGTADQNSLALVADGYSMEGESHSDQRQALSTALSQYEMPPPGRQTSAQELASLYANNILLIATILEMEMSSEQPHSLGEVAAISLPTIYLTALEAARNGTQLESMETFEPELYAAAMTGQFICVLSDVIDQNQPGKRTESRFSQLFSLLKTVHSVSRTQDTEDFYESIGYSLGAYMRHAADSFAVTGDDITIHPSQNHSLRTIILRPGDMAQLLLSPVANPYITREQQQRIYQGYRFSFGLIEEGYVPDIRSYSNLYEQMLASHTASEVE